MAFNPYELISAYDPVVKKDSLRQQGSTSNIVTDTQKMNLVKRFLLTQEHQRKIAKDKADLGELEDVLNVVSLFLGPLGAALTQGIKSIGTGVKAKEGMQYLEDYFPRSYEKSFLEDEAINVYQEIKDSQISDWDILGKAFSDATSSYVSAEGHQSKELGQALMKGMKDPGKGILWEQLKKSFSPKQVSQRKEAAEKKMTDALPWSGFQDILETFDFSKGFDFEDLFKNLFKEEEKEKGKALFSQFTYPKHKPKYTIRTR